MCYHFVLFQDGFIQCVFREDEQVRYFLGDATWFTNSPPASNCTKVKLAVSVSFESIIHHTMTRLLSSISFWIWMTFFLLCMHQADVSLHHKCFHIKDFFPSFFGARRKWHLNERRDFALLALLPAFLGLPRVWLTWMNTRLNYALRNGINTIFPLIDRLPHNQVHTNVTKLRNGSPDSIFSSVPSTLPSILRNGTTRIHTECMRWPARNSNFLQLPVAMYNVVCRFVPNSCFFPEIKNAQKSWKMPNHTNI